MKISLTSFFQSFFILLTFNVFYIYSLGINWRKLKKKLEKIRSRGHNNDAYVHVVVMRKKERKKENRNGNWVVVQGVKERAINESERESKRMLGEFRKCQNQV